MRRIYIAFVDLAVGDRFQWGKYVPGGSTTPLPGGILKKVSHRRYEDEEGKRWHSGKLTCVLPVK